MDRMYSCIDNNLVDYRTNKKNNKKNKAKCILK